MKLCISALALAALVACAAPLAFGRSLAGDGGAVVSAAAFGRALQGSNGGSSWKPPGLKGKDPPGLKGKDPPGWGNKPKKGKKDDDDDEHHRRRCT